ncbi:glycosyltransferase, partial [Flavobacteriaceae bacterium]|nr:glycosyltransferase [Flavobacteriaceae bacterium]
MTKNRFIISGGGTGGHIYPALSIANEINKSFDNPEIKFIGARGKMEMNIIPKYGYKIHGLLISGLQRSFTLKNILLPFKLIISFIQSIIIILSFRPNFVVG